MMSGSRDCAATLEDLGSLPPEARATLRAGLMRFLSDVGVTPMVDERTGEMVVDLKAIAGALGMTEEQAVASLRGIGADEPTRTVPAKHLRPLQ